MDELFFLHQILFIRQNCSKTLLLTFYVVMGCGQSTRVTPPDTRDNSRSILDNSSIQSSENNDKVDHVSHPENPIIQTDTLVEDTFNRIPLPPIKNSMTESSLISNSSTLLLPSITNTNANLPPLSYNVLDDIKSLDSTYMNEALDKSSSVGIEKTVRIAEGFSLIPNE
ncbi:uncharacterized protein [Lepeophtheirus salmonis]|uniref:uncharacterized protein n=1 Tax=Lepeophtheirus salmonis TaxID=72036 RepID=UPI001AE9DA5D|nr:uncharacterized protein LOC121122203 [Lepeophtheirus salmonis]